MAPLEQSNVIIVPCQYPNTEQVEKQNKVVSMWSPASSVHGAVAEKTQIHMDYRVLWRKMDHMATLSRGKHLDPCLDMLLLD